MINLNEPVFDSVLAIDAQLQRLQAEVAQMDQEFANYKPQSRVLRDIRQNDDLREPKGHSFSPEIIEEQYAGSQLRQPAQKQHKVAFNPEPQYAPIKPKTRYQNLPQISQQMQSTVVSRLKPQIAKEYVDQLAVGRPDLSILEEEFEFRDKFYEPQYSDLQTADVQFRETESQIRHEETVNQQIQRAHAEDFYSSFY